MYTLFQAVGMVVSLISFPIVTRILTVEEYGHLALFNATVAILLAGAKCGMPTAFIRSYAAALGNEDESKRLYSNAFMAGLALASAVAAVYTLVLLFLREHIGTGLAAILLLAGIPIVVHCLRDLCFAFFRAEERVLTLSMASLLIRVGAIGASILGCLVLIGGLNGFILGAIVFEVVAVASVAATFARRGLFSAARVSPQVAAGLLAFGAPLLLFEMSSLINDYADRFLIAYFLGPADVGVYSVGYNLATYVQGLVTSPLWMSIFPIYTKLWETDGRDKTAAFLSTVLNLYLAVAVLMVLVASLTSREIILLLASAKYEAAAQILPFVIVSIMLYGTTHITGAGFYLTKRTPVIALLTLACAGVHFVLNLFLIPYFGVLGAAYATVLAYLALTWLVTAYSRKLFAVPWPLRELGLYLFAAILAAAAALPVTHPSLLVSFVLKGSIATTVYLTAVLALNRGLRDKAFDEGRRLYGRLRGRAAAP